MLTGQGDTHGVEIVDPQGQPDAARELVADQATLPLAVGLRPPMPRVSTGLSPQDVA